MNRKTNKKTNDEINSIIYNNVLFYNYFIFVVKVKKNYQIYYLIQESID